jgi:hypothetical protein
LRNFSRNLVQSVLRALFGLSHGQKKGFEKLAMINSEAHIRLKAQIIVIKAIYP